MGETDVIGVTEDQIINRIGGVHMSKVIHASDAARLVKDNQTIAIGGFITYGVPESCLVALQDRYIETKNPKDLTLLHIAAVGDGAEGGANHLGEPGLCKRMICAHIGLEPRLNQLAVSNQIEAFLIPQGVASHLTRAIAGNKPGVLTHVGLKTFCDPRLEGCKANEAARNGGYGIVEPLTVGQKEYLLYKSMPIDICFIKGVLADENGNISLKGEANITEQLELAAATHNSGGIVVAEVEKLVQAGTIPAHEVAVHGFMVDHVVVGDPKYTRQCLAYEGYRPEMCGELKIPVDEVEPAPFDVRKVIARRCAFEIHAGQLINLGLGVPDLIGKILAEEGCQDQITLSIESGVLGGVSLGGTLLGGSINPEALCKMPDIFDIYDGGGIDAGFLGAAEIDRIGNVNVSKFAGRVVGPGGFINITQNAKKVCFAGTFTAGKSQIEIRDGKLHILKDGSKLKFKNEVEQVTYSGEYAVEVGQESLYITERAVFKLTPDGLLLTEVAPGVDVEKDILMKMEFRPLISKDLKEMDRRIFLDEKMGLTL